MGFVQVVWEGWRGEGAAVWFTSGFLHRKPIQA
jgi:hypothetical protein